MIISDYFILFYFLKKGCTLFVLHFQKGLRKIRLIKAQPNWKPHSLGGKCFEALNFVN